MYKIFFWLLTQLYDIFLPNIKNLETYFAILICFEVWPLCRSSACVQCHWLVGSNKSFLQKIEWAFIFCLKCTCVCDSWELKLVKLVRLATKERQTFVACSRLKLVLKGTSNYLSYWEEMNYISFPELKAFCCFLFLEDTVKLHYRKIVYKICKL